MIHTHGRAELVHVRHAARGAQGWRESVRVAPVAQETEGRCLLRTRE